LRSFTLPGKGTFLYGVIKEGDRTRIFLNPSSVAFGCEETETGGCEIVSRSKPAPASSIKEMLYDKDNNPLEASLLDGTHFFFENGLLQRTEDKDGHLVQFDFEQSAFGNLIGASIIQNDVTSTYDAEGNLASIKLGELTIDYKDSKIDSITKADGTELEDLSFDTAGNLQNATIITPDGEVRTYISGELKSIEHQDTKILYDLGKPLQLIQKDLVYDFSYTPEKIEAGLSTTAPDALTPVRMEYDADFNLKQVIRQNQEVLNYLDNGSLGSIGNTDPSKTPQVFHYEVDGKTLDYIEQGNIQTFYDANNQPIRSVVNPTVDNPHALDVSYQYGKIREIKKDGILTFKYTYTFDSNNEELTHIEDLEEKTFKVYKGGNLLTSLDNEASVLSTYEYAMDKVSKVTVTRLGRTLHTYDYSYPGDLTVVQDEENVARTYSAGKKLLYLEKNNEKFSYSYSNNPDGEEIVEEKLIEKKLSDGSLVHYENGKASKIDLADGSFITDVVLDDDRQVTKGTINLSSGVKKVFDDQTILEEIQPDGTHFYFSNNKISKVVDSAGKELEYSYEKNQDESIKNIWVKKGDANLEYDSNGNLTGLKLDGVLTPEQVRQATQDAYAGGGSGANSIDGDYSTSQNVSAQRDFDRTQGSVSVNVYSTHSFPEPQTITRIEYSAWGGGSGHGDYGGHGNGSYSIEYQLADGQWVVFPGASGSGSGGKVVKEVSLSGVIAIRAFANGYGEGSDHGSCDAYAYIYEIQYTLADQSFLTFSQVKDSQNQVTGYQFSGYPGTMSFDAQGNLLPGTPSNLNSPAQSLGGAVASLTSVPHFDKINLLVPANLSGWFSTAKNSVLESQTIITQEYSSSGILETQSKADGTVTLFDANNRPTEVLDSSGVILIQYSYDSDGHPTRVYLKNARDTLPDEVLKAKQSIEEGRASSLLTLVQQKNLAYQSIQSQVAAQKQALQSQLNSLQDQFNDISGMSVSGKKAKNQKGDALNQIGSSMDQVRGALAILSSQEADAYAALDSQVKTLSDQIEADSQTAFTALSNQETNLKKEILRQEVSPIVYDYYRRILGRDPSSAEYDYWISKTDYSQDPGLTQTYVTVEQQSVDPKTLPFQESSGQLSIEAEDYYAITNTPNRSWVLSSQNTLFSSNYALVASGASNYENGIEGVSAKIDFKIKVDSPGLYYLWIRGYAADGDTDSVHAGIDGAISPSTPGYKFTYFPYDGYGWSVWNDDGARVAFQISTPGEHTLEFWSREAGFKFDKFILTKNAAFTPSGFSVGESSRVQAPSATTSKPITEALKDYLNALPELAERQTYVSTVKQNVTNQVNSFLSMSQGQKEAFAAGLGLQASDLINLSTSDAQKILTWLGSRSLHFGQSAFLSLESLLDQKGIAYNREDLATKAILIDVLTGVISPLDDGDLVISVYSLNKVAEGYGLTLSGANLSWEDLLAIYQANPTARVIAHINGNHFVVITGVTQNSITYIDPGIGKDKQNESLTVTKEGFLKAWKGNVALEQSKVQTVANYQNKVLSAQETQNIRGAFWGSLLGLLGSIFVWIPGLNFLGLVLTGISTIVSAIEGDWISAISSIVTFGIAPNGLGTFFNNVFTGVTQSLGALGAAFNTVGGFVSNIYNAVTGFFGAISSGIGGFLHGALGVSSKIGAEIARTAVSIGVSFGVSRGLEIVGVNPEIAGFFGSLAAGAVVGGMKPIDSATANVAAAQARNIQSSVQQTVTLTQVGRLGMELGLDSSFTNIIGLSLAAIQGIQIQNPTTTLGQAFSKIKPQLFSSLAQYGVDKLGTSIGFDPRISTLIGTPISGVINAGFKTGWDNGNAIIAGINDGILRGVTSIGIEYATQQADLDPLLGSITSRAITGAIEGALGGNIFGGIYDAFVNSALNVARLGVSSTDPWSQAQYLQRVINFSSIIQQKGLAQAIEDSATQILREDSVSSILQSFNTIGVYIQDTIDKNKMESVQINGVTYKRLNLPSGDYLLFTADQKNLVEIKRGSSILKGTFGKDDQGNWGLITGTATQTNAYGVTSVSFYASGTITEIYIMGPDGIQNTIVKKRVNNEWITFNPDGSLRDADIENYDRGFKLTLKDGLPNFSDVDLNFEALDLLDRIALRKTYDLTDQELDSVMAQFNQISNPKLKSFVGVALAAEIEEYRAGEFLTWTGDQADVGGIFRDLGTKIQNYWSYISSTYLTKSDPVTIGNLYTKILSENLRFFNGRDYGETVIQTSGVLGGNIMRPDSPWLWRPEQEVVIVRYGDKWAAFGERFFGDLTKVEDYASLADPELRDKYGKLYSDPNAATKIDNFMAIADSFNVSVRGAQAFLVEGVYHVKIETQGLINLENNNQYRRWAAYYYVVDDVTLKPRKVYIDNEQWARNIIEQGIGN